MDIISSILGGQTDEGDNEKTVMDPIIQAALRVLITRFGYSNVARVFKTMKPRKGHIQK